MSLFLWKRGKVWHKNEKFTMFWLATCSPRCPEDADRGFGHVQSQGTDKMTGWQHEHLGEKELVTKAMRGRSSKPSAAGAESPSLESLEAQTVYLHFCTWVHSSGSFGAGDGAGTAVSSPFLPLGSKHLPEKSWAQHRGCGHLTGLHEGDSGALNLPGEMEPRPHLSPQADPPGSCR